MKRLFQKTLCGLIAFLLICGMVPSVLAAEAATSGSCGDGVTWTLADGILTISGSGRMTASSGWKTLRSSITSIIIEEGVTSLCTSAFEGCSAATSVSFPSTLTNISTNAFCNCSGLTEVVLPEGLQTIGSNVFMGCTGIVSITLPSTLTALAEGVFARCTSLTSITISEGLEDLSQSAFMNCSSLTSITIPSTVKTIGPGAFFNATKLTRVYFLGDAPEIAFAAASSSAISAHDSNPPFADRVTLYYKADANGWTSPTWNGYKTALWNDSDSPFLDITDRMYSYAAVLWAVEHGITTGTQAESVPGAGDGLFSPERICSRGEILTFLWRANGEPAPISTKNPFSDVTESDYCYRAVLWAVEQGITAGTKDESFFGAGDGLFSPAATCSHSEILTFLWRANGKPEAAAVSALAADYADTEFYKAAVAWADTNGLLMNNSAFVPTDGCSRADAMTYLYLNAVS